MINRIPEPGSRALQARAICDQLTAKVATIAPLGITDFDAVDSAGAEFLLALVKWESDPTGLNWAYVLGEFNDVASAVRQGAAQYSAERDGEGWKYA